MEENSEYLFNFSKDSIINLIASDNFIVVNRSLMKILGLKEAILLGELASEFNYYQKNNLLDENGFFYSTIENIQDNTTLSSYEQKKCLDNLSERGLINVILKGIPAKRHIRINSYQIINLVSNCLETSFQKIKKLDSEILGTNNNNTNNNKENNKEIYKESFEELWKLYPNKKGKTESYKKFVKAIKDGVSIETIRDGIQRYITYIEIEHIKPQYIKNGSTWFNQRCWEDDYSTNRKPTTRDIAPKIKYMDFLKED